MFFVNPRVCCHKSLRLIFDVNNNSSSWPWFDSLSGCHMTAWLDYWLMNEQREGQLFLLKWPVSMHARIQVICVDQQKSLAQRCVTESFSILYIFPLHHSSITVWQHLNYSGLDVQMTKAIWIDLCCFLFSGHSGLVGITAPCLQMSLSKSILVWFLYAFPFSEILNILMIFTRAIVRTAGFET